MKYLMKSKFFTESKKYIKNFNESSENENIGKYYKIFIDGSLEKFEIALKKLGYYKQFCYDWGIELYPEDIMPENLEYFENDIVYLSVRKIPSPWQRMQFGVNNEWNTNYDDYYKYAGEVHIKDYEIMAKKYNL